MIVHGEANMKKTVRLLIVIFALSILVINGYGWNRRGHLTVAAIAYRQLQTDDPARLAKIMNILKKHPAIQRWKNEYNSASDTFKNNVSPSAYVFMRAAAWPDDVRSPKNNPEHHPTWHYINYPLGLLPNSIKFDQPGIQGDIFVAMKMSIDELADSSVDQKEKARKISWLLHLVGDVHQPLHTVALTSGDFSGGDHGGNSECIFPDENGAIILHSYWDDLLGASPLNQVIEDTQAAWTGALNLMQNPPDGITPDQFNVAPNAVDWARESAQFALTSSYQFHDSPVEIRKTKKIVSGGVTKEVCTSTQNWNPLSSDYETEARNIAKRRVLTAGYRLSNALRKIKFN